ncbi:MAG TPA: aminotransferase class V-fold PLP-dependent enzyme [Stellaceae bacterium]|nr:aminotransferase class V-fold PLP-dependent enzyme [Stellaceae bacterium]
MTSICTDYNASTPIDPAEAAAMRPFLDEAFGNPSSGHWASTPAKAALEKARSQVGGLLRCSPDEIVYTSGGSEANNLAIKGTFFALRREGGATILEASPVIDARFAAACMPTCGMMAVHGGLNL